MNECVRKFKHGPELREFWRIEKRKYRARKKAKELEKEIEKNAARQP